MARPSRNRRAPVAADGTVLAVPKVRKYKAREKGDRKRVSISSDRSSDLSSIESERSTPSASLLVPYSPDNWSEGVRKQRPRDDDDDLDIDMATVGPPKPSQRQLPATATRSKRIVESPLVALPATVREEYLPKAKTRILSAFSGQLPPPGRNVEGQLDGSECVGLEEQWRSMYSVLHGTLRGEGNSALLVGAPGTGKSLLLQSVLRKLTDEDPRSKANQLPYHLVHLDGALQPTDRASLRELARQLVRSGAIRQPKVDEEEAMGLAPEQALEDEPYDADEKGEADTSQATETTVVPAKEEDTDAAALSSAIFSSLANTTGTILTLLSSEEAASRSNLPLIIVLSSFDLYTSRPRQALLYVLLDAVQAGSYTPGLCVLGMTSRLDTTELLEKRVRSRFSGRTINVWPGAPWPTFLQHSLTLGMQEENSHEEKRFNEAWLKEAKEIAEDAQVTDCLTLWESMGNDIRTLYCRLFPLVASLQPLVNPSLHAVLVSECEEMTTPRPSILDELTTPEFALLIAAKQLLARDREVFNFAMCFEEVQRFVKRSESDRVGIGSMFGDLRRYEEPGSDRSSQKRTTAGNVNISWHGLLDRRKVLSAFRSLLALELFQPELILNSLSHTAATSGTGVAAATAARRAAQVAKTDFVRVKCTIFPQTIVEAAKSKTRQEPLSVNMIQWATTTI